MRSGSAGKYSLKTLQTTTLKCDDGEYMGITKPLLLKSGTYYFSMESTNADKGGDAYYSVYVNSFNGASREYDALTMPEADDPSIADSLSLGKYDADALADASAASLAELDGKSAWQNLALA